jgi:hypothetical protein
MYATKGLDQRALLKAAKDHLPLDTELYKAGVEQKSAQW